MFRIITLLAIFMIICTPQANAKTTKWDKVEDIAKARLIASGSYIGFQVSEIKDKWYTYWRTPGDGGMAFTIDYTGSKNIKETQVTYPAPARHLKIFEGYDAIESYGYKKEALFPIKITAEDSSKPVFVNASIDFAVCDEVCVFHNSKFSMEVPADHFDKKSDDLIAKTLSKSQLEPFEAGMDITNIDITDDFIKVTAKSASKKFNNPDLFIEAGFDFRFPAPDVEISKDGRGAIFTVKYEKLLDSADITKQKPVFTLVNDGISLEKKTL